MLFKFVADFGEFKPKDSLNLFIFDVERRVESLVRLDELIEGQS